MATDGATPADSPQRLDTAASHTTGSGEALAYIPSTYSPAYSYSSSSYANNRPSSATQWAPSLRVLMEQTQSVNHYGFGSSNRNSVNPSPAPTFTNFSHPVSPIRPIHAPYPLRPVVRTNYQGDEYDLNAYPVSPIMSRSPSAGSDRHSIVSGLTNINASSLQTVTPQPSYVSANSASQVVSEHRAKNRRRPSTDSDDGPRGGKGQDDVQFSEQALSLVNQFLDQLLFTFLSTARSTSLLALRPAVQDALKGRLSKEAIASAEEELKELLGTGEEDEVNTQKNAGSDRAQKQKWDLELVWKRTRLRVMVYTRLGEMEDEDEERFVREGDLFAGSGRRFSQATGLVSWAAAIFLTSVLEYIAEQTLQIAGQAAFSRAKRQSSRGGGITQSQRETELVTVEEFDVEKVALNAMLGRLWRTWRKTLRNNATNLPQSPTSRSTSRLSNNRENVASALEMRRDSVDIGKDPTTAEGSVVGDEGDLYSRRVSVAQNDIPDTDYPEHVLASNIPLPIGEVEEDISEIEIPGLAKTTGYEEQMPAERGASKMQESEPRQEQAHASAVDDESKANLQTEGTRTVGGLPTPSPSESHEDSGKQIDAVDSEPNEVVSPGEGEAEHAHDEAKTLGKLPDDILANQREQKFHASDLADIKRRSVDLTSLLALERGMKDWEVRQSSRPTTKDGESSLGAVEEIHADASEEAPQQGSTAEEISGSQQKEDVQETQINHDRRKSLINIKDMIETTSSGKAVAVPKPDGENVSSQVSGDVSPETTSTPPNGVDADGSRDIRDSRVSHESDESYTLGEVGQPAVLTKRSPAGPQNAPTNVVELDSTPVFRPQTTESANSDAIGVAKTSDYIPGTQHLQNVQTRPISGSPIKQTSRLIITDSPVQTREEEYPATAPPEPSASSREFMRNRSSRWEVIKDDSRHVSPSDQTRWNSKRQSAPQRAVTLTDGPQRTVDSGKAAYRKSWSAALEDGKFDTRPKSLPPGLSFGPKTNSQQPPPVLEHPVVQRMASLKDKGRKASDEDVAALTSANIRGPEDFEMFVQGDETVKYTLTPENVRDTPGTTISHHASTLSALEGTNAKKLPAVPSPIDTRVGRSQTTKQATAAIDDDEMERKRKEQYRRSVSRPPVRNKSVHRKSGLLAREPRVQTESTQDLADFLRSTGPTSKDEPEPRSFSAINRSSTSLHSLRPSSIMSIGSRASRARSTSPGGERTKSLTQSVMNAENVPPVPSLPGKARSNMQAREATGGGKSNSELINFIRDGPTEAGQHRISRNLAPFRTTMDSDQMRDYGDRVGRDRPQDYSLTVNDGRNYSTPSQKRLSANNSRTSLLNGSGMAGSSSMSDAVTAHPAYSGQQTKLSASGASTPSRKQVRNKDPYSIELDEEFNDRLTALPGNKPRGETIVDFLNSEPPKMTNGSRTNSMTSMRSGYAENGGAGGSRGRSMQAQPGPRPGYASSVKSVQSNFSYRSNANPQTVSQSFSPATALPSMAPKASKSTLGGRGPGGPPGGPPSGPPGCPPGAGPPGGGPAAGGADSKPDVPEILRFTGEDPEGPDGGAPAPIVGRGEKRAGDPQPKEKRSFFGRRKSIKKGGIF